MVQVNALNISGAQKPRAYRQEQNQANSAIASDFAGPNEPANPEAYMQWLQQLPGGDKLFRRNSSNTEWLEITPPFFNAFQEIANAGGVKQIQHAVNDVEKRFFNGNVFEPTGTQVTITPSSVDSRILLLANQSFLFIARTPPGSLSAIGQGFGAQIRRTTNGQPPVLLTTHSSLVNRNSFTFFNTRDFIFESRGYQPITVLDNPITLEPVSYEVFGAVSESPGVHGSGSQAFAQRGGSESPSAITAIEVLT